MGITFKAATTATINYATSVSVPRPAGAVAGDVLVAGVYVARGTAGVVTPSGWSEVISNAPGTSDRGRLLTFVRTVGGSDPTTYSFGKTDTVRDDWAVIMHAYAGVDPTTPVAVASVALTPNADSGVTPSVTTSEDCLILSIWGAGDSFGSVAQLSADPAINVRSATPTASDVQCAVTAGDMQHSGGATEVRTATAGSINSFLYWVGHTIALRVGNEPPNAPTLTSLADGSRVDVNAPQTASHAFSDPDPGDSQSAFDHRYRPIGAASWVEAYVVSPNPWVTYPAGTFTDGVDYERQVRTYDSQGVVGPWSTSGFFTGATRPPAPTITTPLNGATVNQDATVEWSAPNQGAYQVQVLDGATVVTDTGEVGGLAGQTDRSRTLEFPTNNVTRTIRVRVKHDGLWSDWYEVTVTVSYTPPAAPVVTLTPVPEDTTLLVGITNPTPGAEQPPVAYNEVWITDPGEPEERRATGLPTNTTWTYGGPVGDHDYYGGSVRVVAVAVNGVTASTTA